MEKKPLVKNSSSRKQVQSAAKKERLRDENQLEDFKKLLQLPEGRRFVWRLMGHCGVFRSSVEHSGSLTYFNEGRRDVGLYILKEMVSADPVAWERMIKENKEID